MDDTIEPNQPPLPTLMHVLLALYVIGGCIGLSGVATIGLVANDRFVNLTSGMGLCLLGLVAFLQYRGTFRRRAASARGAAYLTGVASVTCFLTVGIVPQSAPLTQLAASVTLVATAYSNAQWAKYLRSYEREGGVLPQESKFTLGEIALLLGIIAVVLGIGSYGVRLRHPNHGYHTTSLITPSGWDIENATLVSYFHDFDYHRWEFSCTEEEFLASWESSYPKLRPIATPVVVEKITASRSLETKKITNGWDTGPTKSGWQMTYDRNTHRGFLRRKLD
ncbi:hypothetical protein [Blastopirellula marina]|uniref:Uncharacterized protein n=1 Tax=Blastopirellula marina TaxID=124 RepID=A0A2S8GLB2_9BACT|nr:hypothetical protein [Blastopirellula marina]PQO45225.1 hypothetical protein C5Y93_14780 [Blastopirellula marina]